MKLSQLNEIKMGIVNSSELSKFDNWDSKFWIGMDEYIKQYKKFGKEKAAEFVAQRVKKIGIENYNTLKNMADKQYFGVPKFETVSDKSKIQTAGAEKIVILLDLVQDKAKARKSELEKRLKELQKQIKELS